MIHAKQQRVTDSQQIVGMIVLCLLIDNGAFSPVIQTTNGSRVPSSRPRTGVRPRGKDTMSNAEHKVERKR